MLKISFIAELSDDVAIIGSAENIVAFEDIRMVQLFKGIYLAFKHAFFWFTLDSPDVDYFDGYFFLGFIVAAFVDDGAESSADDVFESIGVILYFFAKIVAAVNLMIVHSNSI